MNLTWHRVKGDGQVGCLGGTELYCIRSYGKNCFGHNVWILRLSGESKRVNEALSGKWAIENLREFAEKDFEGNILPDLMRVINIHLDGEPVIGESLKIAVLA